MAKKNAGKAVKVTDEGTERFPDEYPAADDVAAACWLARSLVDGIWKMTRIGPAQIDWLPMLVGRFNRDLREIDQRLNDGAGEIARRCDYPATGVSIGDWHARTFAEIAENVGSSARLEFQLVYLPSKLSDAVAVDAVPPELWETVQSRLQKRFDAVLLKQLAIALQNEQERSVMTWSIARSPADWLKMFARLNLDCRSLDTFNRRRKDGTLRQHPDSTTKSVRLALDCLPPNYNDEMTV